MSGDRRAFARYFVVGVFNTLLDITLFTLLVTLTGLAPLVANVISTCVTLCVSYLLNRLFVFRSDRSHAQAFVPFVAVTLFSGLLVQSGVIWLVVHAGDPVWPDAAHGALAPFGKVVATGVGMVSNFLGYRWLFGARDASRARESLTSSSRSASGSGS